MEYTIKKLSDLAGVSTRTLRYYDEIGLLHPYRINSSGYRIYGQKEVNKLQQILFYRELGVNLNDIIIMINDPNFNEIQTLNDHLQKLLNQKKQLELLILNVNKTIDARMGGKSMCDTEKFEGFKKGLVQQNEEKYGHEIRDSYGEDVVAASNDKMLKMTQAEYQDVTALGEAILEVLYEIMDEFAPDSEVAQNLAAMHQKWLMFYWPSYSKEAHAGLAQTYVDDERFTAFYDKEKVGAAKYLRDAILVYTSK